MSKINEKSYITLKQEYISYAGCTVWFLKTTTVIKKSGILDKRVSNWKARPAIYKNIFTGDFDVYHKEYCVKLDTTTRTANNAQTDPRLEQFEQTTCDQAATINQLIDPIDRDDTSVVSSNQSILTSIVAPPVLNQQAEIDKLRNALAVIQAQQVTPQNRLCRTRRRARRRPW